MYHAQVKSQVPLTINLWFAEKAVFDINCFLWCTEDGDTRGPPETINPSYPVLYQPSENSSFSHAQDDIAFGEVDKTLVFEPFQLEVVAGLLAVDERNTDLVRWTAWLLDIIRVCITKEA